MPKNNLETRFAAALRDAELLAPDERVAVAVSGGPDSVALLHLICALNRQPGWAIKPHVVHLDHQLRGQDAEADAVFVRELAEALRLPHAIESIDVGRRAADEGVSIEQAARLSRFEFFERVCLRHGIKAIALAHHADDDVETVLHRIVRGTGFRGLAGIPWQRSLRPNSDIRVVRPMLAFRRAEIEAYLQERNIASRCDATNESQIFTRNRIRHELLPLLRERFNPSVDDALMRLAEQARELNDYLVETAERMLESLVIEQTDRQLVLHSPSLARKALVIQMQLIRQAILRMGFGEAELTYGHVKAVAALASSQEGTKELHLPAGLRVSRRYARLVFELAGEALASDTPLDFNRMSAASEIQVAMAGPTLLHAFGLEMDVKVIPADRDTIDAHISRPPRRGQRSYEEWLDADQVCPPLIARSRRPGDRFFPLGMGGMKKLSDYFIDEKIDADQRDRAVILCDRLGPIWIVPFRIDERVRLTRGTERILRVIARPVGGGASP